MKIMTLLYLLVFFLSWNIQGYAQDYSVLEKSIYVGEQGSLPYRILFPEHYDRTRKYPLVLFLHGAGERGSDNEKQVIHGVKHFLEPGNREKFSCILIAPQCPEDDYWASVKFDRDKFPFEFDFNYDYPITDPLQLAIDLTKQIMSSEAVDKDRVYISGLSMGGMGTLEAVYRYPKLFAAAVPVCGAADEQAYKKRHVKIPLWLFHGDEDTVVPVDYSRKIVARLQALGASVKYTEYPGVKHNSWENAYADPELMKWLFGQGR